MEDIRALAGADPAVVEAKHPLTMHLGPDEVLLNLEIDFRPDVSAGQITASISRLEQEIRERHPEIGRIFIEAQALQARPSKPRRSRTPRAVKVRAAMAPDMPTAPSPVTLADVQAARERIRPTSTARRC